MVAVDANGEDLASQTSLFIQRGTDCPPICAAQAWA